MLMKSDQFTNRIRTGEKSVEYLPPGTVFEVEDEKKAAQKIAAGRAELVTDGDEAPIEPLTPKVEDPSTASSAETKSEGDTPTPPSGTPDTSGNSDAAESSNDDGSETGSDAASSSQTSDGDDLEKLQEAILNVDLENPENLLKDGRPKVEVLSEAVGRPVTAVERDAAWESLQND